MFSYFVVCSSPPVLTEPGPVTVKLDAQVKPPKKTLRCWRIVHKTASRHCQDGVDPSLVVAFAFFQYVENGRKRPGTGRGNVPGNYGVTLACGSPTSDS